MFRNIEGLIDTTNTLLTEAQATDKETQAELILKARSNFPTIFKKTNKNSSYIGKVSQMCCLFVRSVTPNLDYFLKSPEKAKQISETLRIFMQASIISDSIAQDLCSLIISFSFNDFSNLKVFPGTKQFEQFFKDFFSSPQFVIPFESIGGLLALWELLLSPSKSYLCGVIYPEITKTIHLYFQSENIEPAVAFLIHIKSTFMKIPELNSILAFQFLYDLFFNSKPHLLSKFIEIGGFKIINQYIIEKNDPQHILFYQMFRPMCTEMPQDGLNKVHPILGELVSLIIQNRTEKLNKKDDDTDKNAQAIQFSALNQLNEAIRQFPKNQCPLQPSDFNELVNSFNNVKESESDSIFLLVKIFVSLSTNFTNFNSSSCLSSLTSIINYNLVMKYDATSMFQVIKNQIGETKFVPYSLTFYNSITSQIKDDEFKAFLKKYPLALYLLSACFVSNTSIAGSKLGISMNEHLLNLIYSVATIMNVKESNLFSLILRFPQNINALLSFLQKSKDQSTTNFLLKVLAHVLVYSSNHQKIFIKCHCLSKFADIEAPPGLIFDVLVALTGRHFSVNLDKEVSNFLKSVNFFKMSEESILKLAFGIYQNSIIPISSGHLVYPSILSHCGNFTIHHPYDLWLCGQYGVNKWLEDTGKTIDQFPCIQKVAQRFLLPKHVQNFFEFPKLFCESCSDIFGSTPLFEFPKDINNTQITIPVSSDSRSVSFWFFVKDYPPSLQNICRFSSMSFNAAGDELFINKTKLTDYPLNRWFHVVLNIVDKNNGSIYIDSKCVQNFSNVDNSNNANMSIIFGTDKANMGYWFLGGCIRVFKTNINQKTVEYLFSQGVRSLIKFEEKSNIETLLVSPSNFVELFGDPKSSEGLLSENSRPVISFSFLSHICRAYNGGTCPLNLIFERLQQKEKKLEDLTFLLDALCSLQKFGFSRWKPNVFAVRMSAIFLLCPELFDSNTFTNVLSCFTSDLDDTIMWDSILTFLLDFGLFNSNHRSFIISKMFEYIAQFSIDKNISQTMTHFIFHVLKLVDCDESDSGNLLALIEKIKPDPNTIATLIASYPSFRENFSSPSFEYKPDFEGTIYKSLFDYLLRNSEGFNHYYIIYVLPPLDAFKLIVKLLSRKKTVLSNDEKIKMIYYCLSKTSMKESWPAIVALMENSQNGKFEFHSYLYIFLSFLGIHALNEKEDSFWSKLWARMIRIASSSIQSISELDKYVMFSLDQLLSFGEFTPYMCPFPYVPSLTEPSDVARYSLRAGQPFPETPIDTKEQTRFSFQSTATASSSITINEDTLNKVLELLPDKKYLFPPNSNKFITCHCDKYTINFIEEVTCSNNKNNWKDWISLLPQIKFQLETLHKSNYMKDAIILVSKILVHFISQPEIFKASFVHLILTHGLINSKHSLFIWNTLFYELCNQCVLKNVFEPFIINFSCFAIGEGWLKGRIIETFKIMFNFIKKVDASITRSLNTYLILSFQLINRNQIPDLLKLFIDYQSLLFSKKNLESDYFTLMLFDRLKTYIEDFKQQTIPVCEILINSLPQLMNTKDDKNEDNTIYKFMIIALKKLCQEGIPGFNQLVFDEPQLETVFKTKFDEIKPTFESGTEDDVLTHLERNSTRRIKLASLFFQIGEEITRVMNDSFMMNTSIASVFRYHERMMLLFDEEFFLRIRERLLTPHQYFKLSLTQTKTLSLLSDPILPTRRLEKSPMLYKIPQFPAVGVTDVSPDIPIVDDQLTILPSLITDQLSIDYLPYEILMMHSPNQLNLTFSYHFEIDDCFLLTILQNLINGGTKFNLIKNVSLLYGLDPLVGCLLMNDDFIYFVEGLSLSSENGVHFTTDANQMSNAIYTFYISYFISGYFGQCYLFSGHPILQLSKSLIISSVPHFWLQKPISIELNFLFGWTFILIANSIEDFNSICSCIDEKIEENYTHEFPPIPYSKGNLTSNSIMRQISSTCPISILSPIKSGKLLKLPLKDITKEWLYTENDSASIDNFTYLCILNKLGSRSFTDFSQYFVFPWIFAEYRREESNIDQIPLRNFSLPMGQIGKDRLERFDSVFEDSGNQYFYGTHYMHLGVVLFYLFRNDPFCLFSIYFFHGYDHPNRVFHEIAEAWISAAFMSPADVKEVVPQMFCVPEFLTNTSSLPLTSTTNGRPVDNVTLAKWSTNPRDFIYKQRKEIESERVSVHINEWIDLIFGFKSRGEAAVEAKNVYQPLCYQSSTSNVAFNSFDDTIDQEAAVTYIINFGQCAKQLFFSPHLVRNSNILNDESSNVVVQENSNSNDNFLNDSASNSLENNNEEKSVKSLDGWMKLHVMSEPSNVTFQKINNKEFVWPVSDIIISNSLSSSTTIFAASNKGRILFNSFVSYSSQRASMVKLPIKSDIQSSEADNSLINETVSKKNNPTKLFETVTSIDFFEISPDGAVVALFQKEGSFIVYTLKYEKGEVVGGTFQMRFQTLSNVSSAAVSTAHFLVIAACGETVQRFDLGLQSEVEPIEAGFIVRKVAIDDKAALIIVAGDKNVAVYSISGSLIAKSTVVEQKPPPKPKPIIDLSEDPLQTQSQSQNQSQGQLQGQSQGQLQNQSLSLSSSLKSKSSKKIVKKRSINKGLPDSSVTAIQTTNLDEYVSNRFFVTGHVNGFVTFWSMNFTTNELVVLKAVCVFSSQAPDQAVVRIGIDDDAKRVVAASVSEMVCIDFYGSDSPDLKKSYAVECAICGEQLNAKTAKVCSHCKRFYCSKCEPQSANKQILFPGGKNRALCKNCMIILNK